MGGSRDGRERGRERMATGRNGGVTSSQKARHEPQ